MKNCFKTKPAESTVERITYQAVKNKLDETGVPHRDLYPCIY